MFSVNCSDCADKNIFVLLFSLKHFYMNDGKTIFDCNSAYSRDRMTFLPMYRNCKKSNATSHVLDEFIFLLYLKSFLYAISN